MNLVREDYHILNKSADYLNMSHCAYTTFHANDPSLINPLPLHQADSSYDKLTEHHHLHQEDQEFLSDS